MGGVRGHHSTETSPPYKLNKALLRLLILRIKENNFPPEVITERNIFQPDLLIQDNFLYNLILWDANMILFVCFL